MSHSRLVIALVRHGEYEQPAGVPSAHLPHPLTAKGRERARDLAANLLAEARARGLELDPRIDSSPLLRAWETATIVCDELRSSTGREFEVGEFEALSERSLGAAANLTMEEIASVIAADPRLPPLPLEWKSHPRFRLPLLGAESLMQAGARTAAHLETRAQAQSPGATVRLAIVIGHGGALRHAAVSLGVLEIARAATLSMHHCGYVLVEFDQGRWTQIGGAWKVRSNPGGGD